MRDVSVKCLGRIILRAQGARLLLGPGGPRCQNDGVDQSQAAVRSQVPPPCHAGASPRDAVKFILVICIIVSSVFKLRFELVFSFILRGFLSDCS